MKIKTLTLITILLIFLSPLAVAWEFDESKVHFYMYGLSTCPHCRHMKEEIPAVYGKDKLTYYELNGNDENREMFRKIAQLTGITGVPTIGIVYNGTLVAVIEGEFNVSATPEIIKTAIDHNATFLFVGGKAYLLPHNDTEAINVTQQLYSLFVRPTPTSTTHEKNICGPATIAGIMIVLLLIRKWKST